MNFNALITNAALAVRADGTYEPLSAEAWKYAGEMTLLGMGMIFAVLAILWGVLAIFKLLFAGREPKQPKARTAKAGKGASLSSEVPDEETVAVITAALQAYREDEERNNTALVAVITAAVAAYRASEAPDGADSGFRVVSFKRVGGGRGWNAKK